MFINTTVSFLFPSFACGSSFPARVDHDGAAAWLAGTLAVPSVQNHKPPPWQELRPYQSFFFEPVLAGDQKASLASPSCSSISADT